LLVLDTPAAKALLERSPFGPWWGFQVDTVDDQQATVTLPARPHMMRPDGILQGGCAMTLADVTTWLAVLGRDGSDPDVVTIQQNTTFLSAGRGDLRCRARVLQAGRTLIHVEATVTSAEDGRAVSHHLVTYTSPRPAPR
jgi:uncharacterized protein (TIGR00369 family)